MRIETYNQVAQIYKTAQSAATSKASATGKKRDEVQISQTGRDYQIAKQAVAEAPDIREDRVAELKAKIDAGSYSVDIGDFASELLKRYQTSTM